MSEFSKKAKRVAERSFMIESQEDLILSLKDLDEGTLSKEEITQVYADALFDGLASCSTSGSEELFRMYFDTLDLEPVRQAIQIVRRLGEVLVFEEASLEDRLLRTQAICEEVYDEYIQARRDCINRFDIAKMDTSLFLIDSGAVTWEQRTPEDRLLHLDDFPRLEEFRKSIIKAYDSILEARNIMCSLAGKNGSLLKTLRVSDNGIKRLVVVSENSMAQLKEYASDVREAVEAERSLEAA